MAAEGGERPARLRAVDDAGRVRGVGQVLVRDAPAGRRVLYVPHGPAWEAGTLDGPAVLQALLDGLRDLGRAERGIVLKLDPRATLELPADELERTLRGHGLRWARADLRGDFLGSLPGPCRARVPPHY